MEEIVLNGRKYKLIPVEEETHSILDDYKVEYKNEDVVEKIEQDTKGEVRDAVPRLSDYRERYKQRKIRANEIQVAPRIIEVEDKTEGMLDGYEYKGEGLFFGAGLEQDI